MTELLQFKELSLTEQNKGILAERIIETAKSGPPHIDSKDNPDDVKKTVSEIVDLMLDLQKTAEETPHQKIHQDIDVVWEITGPGSFSSTFPDKPDRYQHLEWTRRMDRKRLRTSFTIVRAVTALRAKKSLSEITNEDIRQYGPFLVYTSTPSEGNLLREVYKKHTEDYKLTPAEKLIICDKVKNPDGSLRDSYDTVDGVKSFEVPKETARRIVLVSHAQHLARVLYILGNYRDKIPEGTVLQVYPITAPRKGEFEYAVMEARGILAGIYKTKKAANKPYPYQA